MIQIKHVAACLFFLLFILLTSGVCYSEDCVKSKPLFDVDTGADQPSDISIAPNSDIYLVDGVNHRIRVFDKKGKAKFDFGKNGTGKGEFNYPLGIDISDDGKVFIADSGNHRIQVFNLTGEFDYMFSVESGPNEKLSDPVDVLVSKLKNYVYVSDNDNHKIKVYRQNGIFEFEWGRFGEDQGQFRYPGIMAINEFNEIFVVDVLNTRVQKFDPFGNFITDIGSWGVLPGKFFRPKGVAVDKRNRVYISDSYMGLIQVFSDVGHFFGVVCEEGKNKQFVTPVGMAIDDKKQRLHVVEMRAGKISVSKVLN